MLRSEFNKILARVLGTIGVVGITHPLYSEKIPPEAVKAIDFYVAGYVYYDGEKIENTLRSKMLLKMKLELQNNYDCNAIEIFYENYKLGYVPRQYNEIIANLIAANKQLYIRILDINKDSPTWERLKTEILVI